MSAHEMRVEMIRMLTVTAALASGVSLVTGAAIVTVVGLFQ